MRLTTPIKSAHHGGRCRLHKGLLGLFITLMTSVIDLISFYWYPVLDLPESILRDLPIRGLRLDHDRQLGQGARRQNAEQLLPPRGRSEIQPRQACRECRVDCVLQGRGTGGGGGQTRLSGAVRIGARYYGTEESRILHDGILVPRPDPTRSRRLSSLLCGLGRAWCHHSSLPAHSTTCSTTYRSWSINLRASHPSPPAWGVYPSLSSGWSRSNALAEATGARVAVRLELTSRERG